MSKTSNFPEYKYVFLLRQSIFLFAVLNMIKKKNYDSIQYNTIQCNAMQCNAGEQSPMVINVLRN